jgi:hypothetical protein
MSAGLPKRGSELRSTWDDFSRLASLRPCDAHHLLRAWAAMLVYQKIAHITASMRRNT